MDISVQNPNDLQTELLYVGGAPGIVVPVLLIIVLPAVHFYDQV